jgi:UDP-glucose 4-epimerase
VRRRALIDSASAVGASRLAIVTAVGTGRILVTGSAGHLGEAVVRVLREAGRDVAGLDILGSPLTSVTGSVADRELVRASLAGVTGVIHAATLHKPHIGSHERQAFVETNITGTLVLLEEAAAAGVESFVFTSTTSAFGRALYPGSDAPAAWITEDVVSLPRNIYGVTKAAAEDVCELVHRDTGLPVVVLRTSRFFPEADDRDDVRATFDDGNVKANEYLYRRVDIEDVVGAHLRALERAPALGFGKYIVSATTPFAREDTAALAEDAPSVVRRLYPDLDAEYERRDWAMFPKLDRVYVNERARRELGWTPQYDFRRVLDRLKAGEDPRSELARAVGAKGYHAVTTGPYTVR